MINKSVLMAVMLVSLGGCLPYNNYYGQRPAGYYPNTFNQAQTQMKYHNAYQDDLADIGYNENQTVNDTNMFNTAIPVQQVQQHTVYQGLPKNPNANQQFSNVRTPYFDSNQMQAPTGVVGVGTALNGSVNSQAMQHQAQEPKSENLKLIMPGSWRMAHPSIGKGLELANEAERFEFNRILNMVTIKKPADAIIGSKNITVVSLTDSGQANSRGFLCKDIYLLRANRDNIEKMWGKFCRHPNWNEWVLTSW